MSDPSTFAERINLLLPAKGWWTVEMLVPGFTVEGSRERRSDLPQEGAQWGPGVPLGSFNL